MKIKKLKVMSCFDDYGEYQLWFDEQDNLLSGYFEDDAYWRDEYFNPIFEKIGIEIINMKYNKKIAVKARKEIWG